MNSIIQESIKPKNIKLSQKSKNLKLNFDTFWKETTSPIFHRIMKVFYDSIECDSKKFQEHDKQSDVNNALRRLVHDGILHQISLKHGRPSKKKRDKKYFFTLTVEGVKILIDGLSENPQKIKSIFFKDYWSSLSFIFQKNNLTDFNLLEQLCVYHEIKILKIDRSYITPNFFNDALKKFKNTSYDFLWNDQYYYELYVEYEVLKIIYSKNSLFISKSVLIRNLNKQLPQEILEKYIDQFLDSGIIAKINSKNGDKFGLTFIGLLKLFYHLHSDYLLTQRSNDGSKIKKLNSTFEMIRKKYSFMLPMILDDVYFNNLKLYPIGLLEVFNYLYFDDSLSFLDSTLFYSDSDSLKFNTLPKFDAIRDVDFRNKLQHHLNSFTHTERYFQSMKSIISNSKASKSQKQSQLNQIPVRFQQDIVYLKHIVDTHWLNFEPSLPDADPLVFKFEVKNYDASKFFPRPKSHDDAIKRKITFDFYSIYASLSGNLESLRVDTLIKDWYSDQVKKLSDWLISYSK